MLEGGSGQRLQAALRVEAVEVYGSGDKARDFTCVIDIVEANIRAMEKDCAGEVFNTGGGSRTSVNSALTW